MRSEPSTASSPVSGRWWVAAYLLSVAAVVAAIVVRLDGQLVYVLDDPAIHLSLAGTLVSDGTWGVVPGSFESASSSPLWTLSVAAGLALTPGSGEWVPLALNVVAGSAVVVLFGRSQDLVRPGRGRMLDSAAVALLVVAGLFLPGLAATGMEHSLHVLLVLGAVVAVQQQEPEPGRGPGPQEWRGPRWWLPYALLALATLTRFETAFVAAGLAAGVAVQELSGRAGLRAGLARLWSLRRGRIVGLAAASALPLVAFGLFNRSLGGRLLPNPVLAKGRGPGATNSSQEGLGAVDTVNRLTSDGLLVALVVLAVVYLAVTWGSTARFRVTGVAFLVATLLHVLLAEVGWYERYQAYLLAIGLYLALGAVTELPGALRRRGLAALVALVALLCVPKLGVLLGAPVAADEIYRHHYQAGRFLERYYDGEPIATDQLGYISFFHDGPITDLAGLGDVEVLERSPADPDDRGPFWEEIVAERGARVVVIYDVLAASRAPDGWVRAGQLSLPDEDPFITVSDDLQFWAANPEDVPALVDHLEEFAATVPDGVELELNPWAGFQAAERLDATPPPGGSTVASS